MRSRGYCFTINNYTDNDIDRLLKLPNRYLVFGFETGKNGTPHIQGYVYSQEAKTISSLKRFLPRAHLEKANGTPKQNRDYCTKDGEYYEFGSLPEQGKITYSQLVDVMANPKENIQLYHLYRRTYNSLDQHQEKGRSLKLIPQDDIYKVADCYDPSNVSVYPSEYQSESVMIVPCYHLVPWLNNWLHGHPVKERIGFEYILRDPDVIYVYYTDVKEHNYLIKKYIDYIET